MRMANGMKMSVDSNTKKSLALSRCQIEKRLRMDQRVKEAKKYHVYSFQITNTLLPCAQLKCLLGNWKFSISHTTLFAYHFGIDGKYTLCLVEN